MSESAGDPGGSPLPRANLAQHQYPARLAARTDLHLTAAATAATTQPASVLLANAAIDASIIGGAFGVVSSLEQSKDIAGQQKRSAAIRSEQVRRTNIRKLARARAEIGASGAQLSGSPLNVLANESAAAEYDRILALSGGDVAASSARTRGRNAAINSGLGAFGSALKPASLLAERDQIRSRFTSIGGNRNPIG